MPFDLRQVVAGTLTIAMFVMLVNMISNNRFFSFSTTEEVAFIAVGDEELSDVKAERSSDTSIELWGKSTPALQPCWNKHISGRESKTWGYVLVMLSNGPQYHPLQVADAVIVARYLKATLLLPKIKEAPSEPNGEFDKIYDVNNFISSLKDVVRVVGRLPEDVRSMKPTVIKVPYGVTEEYIEENVLPVLKQNTIIQLSITFSSSSLKDDDTATEEVKAIRCLVVHTALRFNSQVQKLGERVISRVKEGSKTSGDHFIAVDLRADVLKQKGCSQSGKSKKCYDAEDVSMFLKRLGFPSETPIYVTQSRWDESLDPLKENFMNVYTKEYTMPFNEEKQILYSGSTQFEKAVDLYVCTHSNVFVPAISGISYFTISGERIAIGKTQILVPTSKGDASSRLKIRDALSKFVKHKDHPVYSCFCKAS